MACFLPGDLTEVLNGGQIRKCQRKGYTLIVALRRGGSNKMNKCSDRSILVNFDRPTDRVTDRPGHREVFTLQQHIDIFVSKKHFSGTNFNTVIYIFIYIYCFVYNHMQNNQKL